MKLLQALKKFKTMYEISSMNNNNTLGLRSRLVCLVKFSVCRAMIVIC